MLDFYKFQWAPTLGGECYILDPSGGFDKHGRWWFQWAPTLGGECYAAKVCKTETATATVCFNGHPPLGVNATV